MNAFATQVRLRLSLLRAVSPSLDRSRQIVVLFIAVVVDESTVADPAAWNAPLRPLLLAPRPGPGGQPPCRALAFLAIGGGGATRAVVFEWSGDSRDFAQAGTSRAVSVIADAALVALPTLPVAAVPTARRLRFRIVDGAAIATLLMTIALFRGVVAHRGAVVGGRWRSRPRSSAASCRAARPRPDRPACRSSS